MEWWIWVLAGFVLLALELASPGGFYLFFFGCAALAVGLLAAPGWAQPLWLQGVLFSGLSVAAGPALPPSARTAAPQWRQRRGR